MNQVPLVFFALFLLVGALVLSTGRAPMGLLQGQTATAPQGLAAVPVPEMAPESSKGDDAAKSGVSDTSHVGQAISETETNIAKLEAAATQSGPGTADGAATKAYPLGFGSVELDAKGAGRIKGQANPGDKVTVMVGTKQAGEVVASADGSWEMSVQTELKESEQALTVSALSQKNERVIVSETVLVTPAAKPGEQPLVTLTDGANRRVLQGPSDGGGKDALQTHAKEGASDAIGGAATSVAATAEKGADKAAEKTADKAEPKAAAEDKAKPADTAASTAATTPVADASLEVDNVERAEGGTVIITGSARGGETVKASIGDVQLKDAPVMLGRFRIMGDAGSKSGTLKVTLLAKDGKTVKETMLPFETAAAGSSATASAVDKDAKPAGEPASGDAQVTDIKASGTAKAGEESGKADASAKTDKAADAKGAEDAKLADKAAPSGATSETKAEAPKDKADAKPDAKVTAGAKPVAKPEAAPGTKTETSKTDIGSGIAARMSDIVRGGRPAANKSAKAAKPVQAATPNRIAARTATKAKEPAKQVRLSARQQPRELRAKRVPTARADTKQARRAQVQQPRMLRQERAKPKPIVVRYALVPVTRLSAITVKPGQSLWTLAERFYGDGERWTEIDKKNPKAIRNPDVIYPGQQLVVRTTTVKRVAIKPTKKKTPVKRNTRPGARR